MITLILLAQTAATLGVAPERAAGSWLTDEDYPVETLRNKWSGPVVMDLSISESGRVVACRTVISSGHDLLDKKACAILSKAARYKPARDENGQAVAAGDYAQFVWTLPGQAPSSRPSSLGPDLVVTVKRLPADLKSINLSVRMVQTAEGIVESCVVAEPSTEEGLNKIACRLAEPLAKDDPVLNKAGAPIRHLRLRRIAFKLAAETGTQ
jgi:TonB family protein